MGADDADAGFVVIGQQMADARRAEELHRAKQGELASPLATVRYSDPPHMRDRYRFVSEPADRAIQAFVEDYAEREGAEIARARDALTMDDLYLLLRFARRCVEASLQDVREPTLLHGLSALSAVDQQRVDFRDVIVAGELIAWAMNREGGAYVPMFERGAARSEPSTAATLRRIAERAPAELSSGMWRVVATPHGPALVDTSFERWEPTVDLATVAFEIADVIEADVYRNTTLSVGNSLPEVWLGPRSKDPAVEHARRQTPAVLSLSATVDPSVCTTSESQMFVVWVAEARSDHDAALLAAAPEPSNWYDAFGIASANVACIVVGRSTVVGVASHERDGSVRRFAGPMSHALERGLRASSHQG